ncbi:MAG: FKBP-type peptidyl-prolyl cis-trans isomerase [Gammaproteobacteria bacterium]
MSRNIILAAVMLAVPIVSLAQDKSPMLDSNLQKFSYAMGYRMARDLLKQGVVEVDAQALTTGVEAAMAGDSFRFTPDEIRTAMIEYQKELVNRKAKEALSNEDTGKAFLLANAQKDGVKKLPDGIQYTVLVEGKGEQPGLSDTIKVHYVGTLLSGTEFDSSRGRGDPAQFKLNQVIPGWQTALAQMPIGSRWKVWIPADQGYGLRGSGAKIGPSETLVFDIELLDIVEKGEAESSVKEPADEATKEPAEAAKK